MENKKGWLRIIEAFIAILLILGVFVVIYSKVIDRPQKSDYIYNLEKGILDEISFNPDLRAAVLNMNVINEAKLKTFIIARTAGFNFTIKICEPEDICSMETYKKEVYSSERVISSTLEEYRPKKLKIFMWLD